MCKTYAEFYNCFSLAPLHASASTISCGLVYLSHKTALYQYVMNHYNSIRLLHLHHSFACDVSNSFPIVLTKKGLKHVMGTKSPFTRQKIWVQTCQKSSMDHIILAVYMMMFYHRSDKKRHKDQVRKVMFTLQYQFLASDYSIWYSCVLLPNMHNSCKQNGDT